jgi:hypothetical protein
VSSADGGAAVILVVLVEGVCSRDGSAGSRGGGGGILVMLLWWWWLLKWDVVSGELLDATVWTSRGVSSRVDVRLLLGVMVVLLLPVVHRL